MNSSLLAHRAAGASAASRAGNVKAIAATATKAPPVDFSRVSSPSTYSFVENNPGAAEFDAASTGFSDYVKATQKLAEMQRLSQALLSNLEEINSLSLQTLVGFLWPLLCIKKQRNSLHVTPQIRRPSRKSESSQPHPVIYIAAVLSLARPRSPGGQARQTSGSQGSQEEKHLVGLIVVPFNRLFEALAAASRGPEAEA